MEAKSYLKIFDVNIDAGENVSFPIPGYLTPPQIATAYNIPASTGAGIKVGIISLGGGFLQSDLNASMAAMGLTAPTVTQVLLNGATGTFNTGTSSLENTLDIYCVAGMVPGATITLYITTSSTTTAAWNGAFQQAVTDGCDVITHSWGAPELYGDFCASAFANAATANIPILVASGDAGSDNGNGSSEGTQYPASSAGVIAVGGTRLVLNTSTNTRLSETLDSGDPAFGSTWGGGGGISSFITLPSFQSGLTYETYNTSTRVTGTPTALPRRGVPDISAPMNAYIMYFNGTLTGVGGTSAAAPVMAGMIARLKALTGKALSSAAYNALFYANTGSFYDITTGTNATEIANGYAATVGWDAASGLGSPNGGNLLSNITPYTYELNVSYGANANQYVNLYVPSTTPKGTILHIHGGAWVATTSATGPSPTDPTVGDGVAQALASAGYAVINMQYRDRTAGAGGGLDSTGTTPGDILDVAKVLSLCLDSTAATTAGGQWPTINTYISNHGGLVVGGGSAGGHLTISGVCYYGTSSGKWPKAAISYEGPLNLDYFTTATNYFDPYIRSTIVDQYIHTGLESDQQLASPFYQYGTQIGEGGAPAPGPWFNAVNTSSCKFFFIHNENDTLVPLDTVAPTIESFATYNSTNTVITRIIEGPPRGDFDGFSPITNKGTLTSTSQLPSSGNTLGDMYSLPNGTWVYNNGTYVGDSVYPASVNGFTLWFQHNTVTSEQQVILDAANVIFGALTLSPSSLPQGIVDTNKFVKLTTGGQNVSYSQQFTAGGGSPPYVYSICQGVLPAGVILNPSTGLLSGTPTNCGMYTFAVRAVDAKGASVRQHYQLTITSSASTTNQFTNLTHGQDVVFSGYRYPRSFWHDQYSPGIGQDFLNSYISDSTNLNSDFSAKHLYVVDEIHWAGANIYKPTGTDLQAICDYWRSKGISPGVGITPAAEQGYGGFTPVSTATILADAIIADWVALDPYLYTSSIAYYNSGTTTINQTTINNTIAGLISWTQGWINRLAPYNVKVSLITQGIREIPMPLNYVNQYLAQQYSTFNSSNIFARTAFPYKVLQALEKYEFVDVDVSSYVTQYPFFSSDDTLSSLTISNGTLSPSFSSTITSYSTTINSSVATSITVTPTANQQNATITLTTQTSFSGPIGPFIPVVSGSASQPINLVYNGSTPIGIEVTAQNGINTQTYQISVYQPGSSDATLDTLTVSNGALSPSFVSTVTSYTVSVVNAITSISLTPTVHDPRATVTVGGNPVTSGSPSPSIPLSVGDNTIVITVTSGDGVHSNSYIIVVTRGPVLSSDASLSALTLSTGVLSPTFSPGTNSYTSSVSNSVSSVFITAIVTQANATMTVNGNQILSGVPSVPINLNTGTNVLTIIVTAQDGITIDTYTVVITRATPGLSSDASLSSLSLSSGLLNPTFSSSVTGYTDAVSNSVTSVTIIPVVNQANATIKINGNAATSGVASSPFLLNVGNNTITVVVTAQDGTTTKTYTIIVNRASTTSNDATLAGLSISSGSLTPAFASTVTSYTVAVTGTVSSVVLTPIVNESHATVQINGTLVNSGSNSNPIVISTGSNTITCIVTAQDGTTKLTYTIIVSRPSTDAYLSNLFVSNCFLTPQFNSTITSYITTSTNIGSVTITPTAEQTSSSITVNGTLVASGVASNPITLSTGSFTTATIFVTAQDGVTTNAYIVSIDYEVIAEYTITADVPSVNEGGTVNFTVTTPATPDNTTLYWNNIGSFNGSRFSDGINSGTVVIVSNTGVFGKTITADQRTDGITSIVMSLSTSTSSVAVATSNPVVVNDTSTTPVEDVYWNTSTGFLGTLTELVPVIIQLIQN